MSYLIQVEVDYDEAGVGAGHEALEGGAVERVLVGEVLAHRARRVTAALKKNQSDVSGWLDRIRCGNLPYSG